MPTAKAVLKIVKKICDSTLKTKDNLRKHMLTHPTGDEELLQCQRCDVKFTRKTSYRRHMKRHKIEASGERFKCPFCPKAFVEKGYLRKHSVVHSGDHPYQCSLCDKRFKYDSNRSAHVKTAHANIKGYLELLK